MAALFLSIFLLTTFCASPGCGSRGAPSGFPILFHTVELALLLQPQPSTRSRMIPQLQSVLETILTPAMLLKRREGQKAMQELSETSTN